MFVLKIFLLIAPVLWTYQYSKAGAEVPVPAPVPEDTVSYASVVALDSSVRLPGATDEQGIATRYGEPGDIYAQRGTACAPHNKINATEHTCAHRWYPCGTILIVEDQKTRQRNWCVVRDRGPFGASVFASDGSKVMISPKKAAWYIKIRETDLPPDDLCPDGGCTGRWRGILDMSPAVSKGMGHTGWGAVKVWRLKRVVDLQRYLAKRDRKPSI
jgi:hypothetical protein